MTLSFGLQSAEYFKEKADQRAHKLFKAKDGEPQLQVHRAFRSGATGKAEGIQSMVNKDVQDLSEIRSLEKANDIFQTFIVRQDRSWTTLNTSRELFETFINAYAVFSQFWKVVFTFGTKYTENEFEFPRFRSLSTSISDSSLEVQESTYVIRRVELHHRELSTGQSPWSIRQTGVYHRLTHNADPSSSSSTPIKHSKCTFLLVSPSPSIEGQLSKSVGLAPSNELAVSPWNLHRLLVAESLEGWMDYMAWLETNLRDQSIRIALVRVGSDNEEEVSPFTEFSIEIADRQDLKMVEDSVIELQIIVSTKLNTIFRIRKECRECCKKSHVVESCGCKEIIEEFDEYIEEVKMYIERAKSLRERVKSTIQLLSDLLSYEDAVALKNIAHQSRMESKSLHSLTERSTNDAAAVKVLTIISLVYLPTTIVLNFFSTQFVHSTDTGNMKVSGQSWLLAIFAIPLTALTVGTWWAWMQRANFLKVLGKHRISVLSLRKSIRSSFSFTKAKQARNLEAGVPSPAATTARNSSLRVYNTARTTVITNVASKSE